MYNSLEVAQLIFHVEKSRGRKNFPSVNTAKQSLKSAQFSVIKAWIIQGDSIFMIFIALQNWRWKGMTPCNASIFLDCEKSKMILYRSYWIMISRWNKLQFLRHLKFYLCFSKLSYFHCTNFLNTVYTVIWPNHWDQ